MKISKFAFLLVTIVAIFFLRAGKWKDQHVLQGDSFGYYAYLPALFEYHDLTFRFQDSLSSADQQRYWLYKNELGNKSPKMTIGLALCWLPGYVLVEIGSKIVGFDGTGWETPYQLSVGFTSLIFLLFGLSALLSILKRRFSEMASYSAVLLIVFATNLLYYAAAEPGMGHVYSFSILALSLNFFDLWSRRNGTKFLLVSMVFFGWLVLIRPTNIVLGITFLGFLFEPKKSINWKEIIAVLGFAIPIILQMIFWRWNSGNWLFYSYGDEKLFFDKLHIFDGLLSYRNGWFIYTPIAVMGCFSLLLDALKSKLLLFSSIALLVHIYVVFAWWCWYYGDSLSIRPMVDAYAIVAIGLANVLDWVWRQKSGLIGLFIALAIALIYNNRLQYQQYLRGQLTGSTMSKAAFSQLFFNANPSGSLEILGYYKHPDNDHLRLGLPERTLHDTIVERTWDLLEFSNVDLGNTVEFNGEWFQQVTTDFQYSSVGAINAAELNSDYDRMLELEYEFETADFQKSDPVLVIQFRNDKEEFWGTGVDLKYVRGLESGRNSIKAYFKKPQNMPESAELRAFLWIKGKEPILFKKLTLKQIDCPYKMQ